MSVEPLKHAKTRLRILTRRIVVEVVAVSLFAIGLSGCAVGPDYSAPIPSLAPFHHAAAVADRKTTQPAPWLDAWWTGFDDPMLTTLVQRALAQNLDLAAALARVQQARAAAAGADAQLLPNIDADAQATAERQSLESPIGRIARGGQGYKRDQQEYTVGGAASWEIDLFGGLRRGASAANDEAQAAEAEQLGTRITVAADTADAYLQIRGYQARPNVAERQVDADERLLELVRLRFGRGLASDREVAQAEALLQAARVSVPPLRTGLEAQLNRLDVLLGVQPGTNAQELESPSPIPAPPAIGADNEPLNVFRRRPDIIAAERRLAASSERIGVAIADYYPKISLSGLLGFDSVHTGNLFSAMAFQPVGAGALRWRLFDFGKIDSEVEQARGSNREALALYRQAVLKAAEDVENAFMAMTQTEAKVVELEAEVAQLTRSRDLSQQAYVSGAIALTDVLDADRQLLAAQDDLDSNRADAARAAVASFRALGGGWNASGTEQMNKLSDLSSMRTRPERALKVPFRSLSDEREPR